MAFYGLDNLDARIAEFITSPVGTFVELGAFDGIRQNNTLHFEEIGWRGVLIEPIPEAYEACRRNRPLAQVFNCACVPPDFPDPELEMISVGLMSLPRRSLGGGENEELWVRRGEETQNLQRQIVRVTARTLDSVLIEAEVAEVDLLVLDVEGAELGVLAGLDLKRWRPGHIVCEDAYNFQVQDFLLARGYQSRVLSERKHTRDVLYVPA